VLPVLSCLTSNRLCRDCERYWPNDLYIHLGICEKENDRRRRITTGDSTICEDFDLRHLDESQISEDIFFWCGTCVEYFCSTRLSSHHAHVVYKGVAGLDEDIVDMTMAGD
jgi:hypothetical protein